MFFVLIENGNWCLKNTKKNQARALLECDSLKVTPYFKADRMGLRFIVDGKQLPIASNVPGNLRVLSADEYHDYEIFTVGIDPSFRQILLRCNNTVSKVVSLAEGSDFKDANELRGIIIYLMDSGKIERQVQGPTINQMITQY